MSEMNPYSVAVILLHPACNMICTFCITEDNFNAMTQDQASGLLRTLKQEGFKNVIFGGGEPFQWPGDLMGLTQEAKQLGFLVQVGTNAVALPKDFQNIQTIDRYVLPLESATDTIHNKMRLYKNKHHQIIIDGLKRLQNAQKSVTLSTIVTRINKEGIQSLALFLKELDLLRPFVHAWHLYQFIPQGRGGSINADTLWISDREYMKACEEVLSMKLPFKVYRRQDMYRSKTVDFFWYEHGQLQRASANGNSHIRKMTVPVA